MIRRALRLFIYCSSSSSHRAAQRLELQGVQAYNSIEGLHALHTLPTAVVDYRGVRLSAQGLAPGLEGSDQDQEAAPAARYVQWIHRSVIYFDNSVESARLTIFPASTLQRFAVWSECRTPRVPPAQTAS